MLEIINVVLPTLLVILVGFLIGKFSKIDFSGIVELLFWVGIPMLAFTSLLDKKIVLADAGKVWASALLIMVGCGITGWLVFRALKQRHSGVYLPIIIMNTVNIPFPIISMLYGDEGLFAAVLFYIPNMIVLYSFGVILMSRKNWKEGLKELLKVPVMYAAVFGLAFNLLRVSVPEIILRPLNLIGDMVVPMVLIVLGAKLASVKFTSLSTTVIASAIRIGIGFLLGLLAVKLFNLTGILRAVVIFDAAMPAAVNTSLLAMKYNNEPELVSSVVFFTTIASLVMIPVLVWMLA